MNLAPGLFALLKNKAAGGPLMISGNLLEILFRFALMALRRDCVLGSDGSIRILTPFFPFLGNECK